MKRRKGGAPVRGRSRRRGADGASALPALPIAEATRPAPFGILFAVLFILALASGENRSFSWHAGSHYALVQAMGERASFEVGEFRGPAGTDVAVRDGRWYSAKSPGLPFAALPFYWVGKGTAFMAGSGEGSRAAWTYRWTRVVPAASGAFAAVLVLWLLLRAGLSRGPSVVAAWAFGLGSQTFKYAPHLFTHPLSAALALLFLALLVLDRERPEGPWIPAAAVVTGVALTVEMSHVYMVPALLLAALLRGPSSLRWALAFLALSLIPLALYQTACFGKPWLTSYHFPAQPSTDGFVQLEGFTSGKLLRLLTSGTDEPRAGLLWLSPIALLAPIGAVLAWRRFGPAFAAGLSLMAAGPILTVAGVQNIFGGGTNDIRYLTGPEALAVLSGSWAALRLSSGGVRGLRPDLAFLTLLLLAWQVLVHLYFRVVHADRFLRDFVERVLRLGDPADLWRKAEGVTWDWGSFALALFLVAALVASFRLFRHGRVP